MSDPSRRVTEVRKNKDGQREDVLECGHKLMTTASVTAPPVNARRRRCWECGHKAKKPAKAPKEDPSREDLLLAIDTLLYTLLEGNGVMSGAELRWIQEIRAKAEGKKP